jgi:hypothetical protein
MSKQTTAVSIFGIVAAVLVLVAVLAASVSLTTSASVLDSAAIDEVRMHLNEARMAAENNDMAGVQTHLDLADMKLAELSGGGNMTS